ncbi:hypothetical protein WOA01_17045 [Methylocystis sp. IM2]|uniref:hypothetical protein n=1 Tax=Methylocystis sp. IM2 TaxID=3136563 RepID=UPI0030F98FC2
MSNTLIEAIADHMLAVRAFRYACKENPGTTKEHDAFEAERLAMMALLSFPPETIEQARVRAAYLMTTRFPHGLNAEGFAFLQSFTTKTESPDAD